MQPWPCLTVKQSVDYHLNDGIACLDGMWQKKLNPEITF